MKLGISHLSKSQGAHRKEDKDLANVTDAQVSRRHSPITRAPTDNTSKTSEVCRRLLSAGSTKSYVNVVRTLF